MNQQVKTQTDLDLEWAHKRILFETAYAKVLETNLIADATMGFPQVTPSSDFDINEGFRTIESVIADHDEDDDDVNTALTAAIVVGLFMLMALSFAVCM